MKKKPQGRTTIIRGKSPGRPPGRTGAQTRDRIMQTAASMFALHGFHNVSLNDIAGACGITGPAVYNHFLSKDVLFTETVCTMYEEINEAFGKVLSASKPLDAIVEQLLDTSIEIYRDDGVPAKLGLEARLAVARDRDRFAAIDSVSRKIEAMFVIAISRATKAGELPSDTDVDETGALMMHLIMSGLASRTLSAPAEAEFRRTVAAFKKLLQQFRTGSMDQAAPRSSLALVSKKHSVPE